MLIFQTVVSQEKIVEEYPQAFIRALKEQKNVIFIFSHENCGWCRIFDRYHADPDVKEILGKEYLIHKIDISDTVSGKSLFEHYKLPGIPVWMIFNSKKELLSDGKYEDGDVVGYPIEPPGMEIYLEAIRRTSGHINEKQLQLLGEKLVYFDKEY